MLGDAYIYVSSPDERGCVKIGMTSHIGKRVTHLWRGKSAPCRITYWGPFPRSEAYRVEQAAHALVDQQSAGNEWFFVEKETAIKAVEQAARERDLELGKPMNKVNAKTQSDDAWAEIRQGFIRARETFERGRE